MAKVEVQPNAVVFEAESFDPIMDAAMLGGFTWPTVCGGRASCTACVMLVLEGEDNLSEVGPMEEKALQNVDRPLPDGGKAWRLACQAKATGDIVVKKIGVRPM